MQSILCIKFYSSNKFIFVYYQPCTRMLYPTHQRRGGGRRRKFSAYPYHLKFAKVNYHIKFKKKLLEVFAIINKIYWNNIWIRKWMKEWLIRRWKRMSCSERAMKTGPWNWNCVQWSSSLAKRQNSKIKANIPTILYY